MTVTARKYNPGFLTDDELVGSFCVRTTEFEMLVEVLRECTGPSNPHQIVIGPRGSGKTSLLLRVAAEVRRDAGLAAGFFPVVFAEESYEVSTAGEFWLECLSHLSVQAPRREDGPDLQRTFAELRTVRDDRELAERSFGALLDFSDREGKRLVLLVENLNMLFRDMADPDAGWRLRKVLQTEPRIVLLASATSRFDEIDDPDHALYDLFSVRTLRPLDTGECATLWEAVAGRCPLPGTIRSIEILTGGSPRLVAIVARFGAELSFRTLMANLLDLIDDHTEYFKSHLELLPAQERRVYLALAALWKPATTREIADQSRMETSKCSAQLTRLTGRGVVQSAGGSARRKQYYLTERLYNIYYLMRRSRRSDRLVEALIHFMESYYSPSELKDIGVRIIQEAESFTAEMKSLAGTALARLIALPALASYRGELLAMISGEFAEASGRISAPAETADAAVVTALSGGAVADETGAVPVVRMKPEGYRSGLPHESTDKQSERTPSWSIDSTIVKDDQSWVDDTLTACDEVVRRFGESEIPEHLALTAAALVNKGVVLGRTNRQQEALAACEEVIRRSGEVEASALVVPVAIALATKGAVLYDMHRPREALEVCDKVVRAFEDGEAPSLLQPVAMALVTKGAALDKLHRPQEALIAFDEVVRRFAKSKAPNLLLQVARAIANKGFVLVRLNQPQDALAAFDDVMRRIGKSEIPEVLELIAGILVSKGTAYNNANQPKEALNACDQVLRRFGETKSPIILAQTAMALVNKGCILRGMGRLQDALAAYDEVVRRFGEVQISAVLEEVAKALVNKGILLGKMNRSQDALATYDEMVRRFGETKSPILLAYSAGAFVNKGVMLREINRPQDALSAYEEVVRRFGESGDPILLDPAATALFNKGALLGEMNRSQEALATYDEVARRFGETKSPAILYSVAKSLVNKGALLRELNRPLEALGTYDEVGHRFGESEIPNLLESVATALFNKGTLLDAVNRPREALISWDEVLHRFGESEVPAIRTQVAKALSGKGVALAQMNRSQEALEACDDVVRRFGECGTPAVLQSIAAALTIKGIVLTELSQPEDALVAWDEIVSRFGEDKSPAVREWVEEALLGRADIEIEWGQYEMAAKTAGRVIDQRQPESPEMRVRSHLTRARAILATGDRSASERDVRTALEILQEVGSCPRGNLDALVFFSNALGLQRMCELIKASPSESLLLPLTTALERELGIQSRVAGEVEEVAEDIRRDLAELRGTRSDGTTH